MWHGLLVDRENKRRREKETHKSVVISGRHRKNVFATIFLLLN